ncbi:alpha/beta fold hydrolase [Amycolatopsis kentuckyensis]|uniref:alpha/beta fold hydrolase n=1 Tax=Amycolatopsis kentuckyensis TaxID=218823 RepID=UPI003563FCF0
MRLSTVSGDMLTGGIFPRLPGARVDTVRGGGHWLHGGRPRAMAEKVLDFLRKHYRRPEGEA